MKTAKCPTCRGVSSNDGNKFFPFCAERCQLVDLGRWLSEDYKIAEDPENAPGVEALARQKDEEG